MEKIKKKTYVHGNQNSCREQKYVNENTQLKINYWKHITEIQEIPVLLSNVYSLEVDYHVMSSTKFLGLLLKLKGSLLYNQQKDTSQIKK